MRKLIYKLTRKWRSPKPVISRCKRCGKQITDKVSVVRGYGPVCYKKEQEKNNLKLWK